MRGRLRVGIIGAGYGQHVQVPAFRSDGRATVVALCASTAPRARTIADRLDVPRAFGDWRALVIDPEVDVISVSVPPALQAEIVIAAANAGKHVLVEKPLALTRVEAQAMVDAVEQAGVVGAIDFEFRQLPAWERIRALLAQKELGRVRQVHFSWRIETMAYRENKLGWKRDAAAGGGALNLFGSHALDSILWAFGPVERLMARSYPEQGSGTAEAGLESWLEIKEGPMVCLSVAADAPHGSGYRLEVCGEQGALLLENRTSDYAKGFTLSLGKRGDAMCPIALPTGSEGGDGRIAATAGVVRAFIDTIAGSSVTAFPGLRDGLRVQELIDAIRQADRTRTWQHLT